MIFFKFALESRKLQEKQFLLNKRGEREAEGILTSLYAPRAIATKLLR